MFECTFDMLAMFTTKEGKKVVVFEIDGKKKAIIFEDLMPSEISTRMDYVEIREMGIREVMHVPTILETRFGFIGVGGVEVQDIELENYNPAELLETVELFKIINRRYINEKDDSDK